MFLPKAVCSTTGAHTFSQSKALMETESNQVRKGTYLLHWAKRLSSSNMLHHFIIVELQKLYDNINFNHRMLVYMWLCQ